METDLERVAKLWDKTATERAAHPVQGWLDSPIILEKYVQPKITGTPHLNWLVGIARRVGIPKGGRWLSLGCGAADQEIHAASQGLFASMLALDASPVSLEHGRKTASDQGISSIEFREVDFNRLNLPAEAFDVVLMGMSLHHVLELGYVLSQVKKSMKRSGFFVINEFVGPRQFQFTELQLELVRELLDLLPSPLRQDSATGSIKTEYVRLPVEHWNIADPSEAIRSDRIVREVEKRFRVVAKVDYGGTILNLLLEHIAHNFRPEDEKDVAILRLLAATEDLLIRYGTLPSDFTVMAMRKDRFPVALARRIRLLGKGLMRANGEARLASAEPRLPTTEASEVDFRKEAHSREVLSGFYHWEGSFRWMEGRGDLVLRMTSNRLTVMLSAPVSALRARRHNGKSVDVKIQLASADSRVSVDLGTIVLDQEDPVQHTLEVPPSFRGESNELVRVRLSCDRVWVPAEVLPGSSDQRRLTVCVFQVGFRDGP